MWTVITESIKNYRKWWYGLIALIVGGYMIYMAVFVPPDKQSGVIGSVIVLSIFTLLLPAPIIWIISWIKQTTTDGYPISEKTFMILYTVLIVVRMAVYMIGVRMI